MTAESSTPRPGLAAPAEDSPAAAAPGSPPASSGSIAPLPPDATADPAATGAWRSGQRPPAPPPPPSRSLPPDQPPAIAEAVIQGRVARRHSRHRLAGEPPARVTATGRQPIFVTLSDISAGGCSILRKGRLELAAGDAVMVDIWTQDIETKLAIHARVCWTSQQEATSRAGLRFVDSNHRLQRQIEAYVQHMQQPRPEDRPVARVPSEPRTLTDPAQSAPLERDATAPARRRPRRQPHGPLRAAGLPELASMPRPVRLSSLELQRRMRPEHREEVARIAEESGSHIHTLYGWLRALRLEGDVTPGQPSDPEAWSATDKFTALLQVAGLSPAERTGYCERHGLREEQLQRWLQAALQAQDKPLLILRAEEELGRLRLRDQHEIRRLQKELRRKERSLAINDELLQVVRKLQTLWEQDGSA